MSEEETNNSEVVNRKKNRAKRVSFSSIDPEIVEIKPKDEQPSSENTAGIMYTLRS
jgi:hypothetical protein